MKTYKDAGVDLDKNRKVKEGIKALVRKTFNSSVVGDVGLFGGMFDASALKDMKTPVLVSSTDSVGTKLKLAKKLGKWDKVGFDIVNHCINDILVQGAKPLFVLDYIAGEKLEADIVHSIVEGLSKACIEAGAPLVGGETAELPGVYEKGEYDLAGTIVGIVDKQDIIDGKGIAQGDVVFGLPSAGLHTNGYSLARKLLDSRIDEKVGGVAIGKLLLEPHKSYLKEVFAIMKSVKINGMAHITGGGWEENIPRVIPKGLGLEINKGSWDIPRIFTIMQEAGGISDEEMFRTFNMGIGFVVIVSGQDAGKVSGAKRIGVIKKGEGISYV